MVTVRRVQAKIPPWRKVAAASWAIMPKTQAYFTRGKLLDLALNALAVVLAGGCSFFAGYMILRLQGMDNPPADMGVYFPPARTKVITDPPVEVDPQTTGTIGGGAEQAGGPVAQPFTRNSPVLDRQLLTVIDGLAFVRLVRVDRTEVVALGRGAELPGAGTIRRIERSRDGWRLVADGTVLETARR